LLPINQNQALFSLLLTTYGGDGRVNFALPNLQGRVPIHIGNGFAQGQAGGEQAHTLTIGELPQHIHSAFGSSTLADQPTPGGNLLGTVDVTAFTTNVYAGPGNLVAMTPATIANAGGSQAHLNMQPFLTLNFCIALQGAFPSRN
jgi:microcystin-dependent protein